MTPPLPDPYITALPHTTVRILAQTSSDPAHPQHIQLLREAGYEGGRELAQAFEKAVTASGGGTADELPLEQFNARVAEFFELSGWGRLSTSSLHDIVAAVDLGDCWEARMHGPSAVPCCHITTGALAAFFSSFAPFTLGALEVECAAAGRSRCRFLLGPAETLSDLFARVARGQDYGAALAQLSETSASA